MLHEIGHSLGLGHLGGYNAEEGVTNYWTSSNWANDSKAISTMSYILNSQNPNIDAKTHPYISTGLHDNKFGIDYKQAIEAFLLAQKMPNLEIKGLDCHIGSQITNLLPFEQAFKRIEELVQPPSEA